jgi:hypothetical protein
MEDDNELGMGLFEGNQELNFNFALPEDNDTDEQEENDNNTNVEDTTLENNNHVEDNSSEEVDEEDVEDEGSEGSESSSNLYSSLAAFVHEQGLLPSLDIDLKDIKSADDFASVFNKELDIQAELRLNDYLANLDLNKIGIAKKDIQDLNTINSDSLKNDIDLAKRIIYDDYLNQGLDEKKANRMLNRLIDLGEDAILEDAEESLESLKEFKNREIEKETNSYKERLEAEKVNQAKLDEQMKKTIYESKDLISGLKPNKALQDKVYKSINDIVGKSPDGTFENKFMKERRENPLEFEIRMYHFYELTNGFKDLSKISTTAKSSAVKDLEKIARQTKLKDNGVPLWQQDANTYDNFAGHVLNI